MNLNEFIQKEIRTTLNGRINEGRPIPMDTPNTFIYPEFKMYASKNKKMFKKELEKSKGDSSKMSLTLSALWYKWARQNHKEFTHIKDNKKFGRALMVMMVKDDVIFSIDAFKKTNNITKLKEDIVDQAFLDAKPVEDEDESVEEAAKRDYKKEYEKYGKSEKAKKYRAELNKYNRDKGTYGNGDGKDASHKGGKIVGFEDESKNRGRAEKSRLKKEATFVPNSGTMSGGVLRLDNRKYQLKKDIKNVKIGNYIVTLPKGTILYNIAGGLFADHKSLEQYADRNRQYFKKPTFKGIQITQKTDTIKDIDKNSKVLESVNEVKDNLYLQLHKKYAEQIKGLKANKIKKLSDLVWVQRRSMSDRDDYFDMDSKKKKELSAEYRIERNLLKKYMARDYSVMLPKGTEKLPESVNEGKYYITRNLGRGQGKALVGGYDLKRDKKLPPKVFKSYRDAEKEVKRLERGGSMGGQMTAYIITDKDMNPLTENQIDEKLITFSNRAPYGQIVFMAGGAGSGKGFAIDNFIDAAGFKVRDVDEMKKAVGKLDQLGKFSVDKWYKKYGKKLSDKPGKSGGLSPKAHVEEFVLGKGMSISDISKDLKNPNNVASLHYIVDSMGLKDKWLISMLSGKTNKETLPNLLFDITAKKVSSITEVIKPLIDNGYDTKHIHLIWVLANFHVAIKANKERDRMVPEDILLQTHEGAGKTMWELMTKILPKGLNGRIDVILNKRAETVPYVDSNGKPIMVQPNQKNKLKDAQIVVKGFTSLPIKKQGGGVQPEKAWKEILKKWVLDNAPKTIDLSQNLGESVNEANDTYFKTAGEAVDFAKTKAEKKGFEIDEDDWNNQITHGGRYSRLRPSVGKTHTFQIGLLKKGKPQRKGLSISLFGMDSGNYELTYYIN